MTNNELPVQTDAETGLRFAEAREVSHSDHLDLEWSVEAIEGDCSTIEVVAAAYDVEGIDALMAKLAELRKTMVQAKAICGQ